MGTKDILIGCNNAKITNGDIGDFCDKIVSLLKDEQTYKQTKLAAVKYAKQWDSTTLADNMLEFYQQII
jgi:hypothetical protein